jgi:DNA-binding response OmpR family regulator
MSRKRILLVDDCIDTLELLKTALEENFEVFGIEDPHRFDDAADLFEPDLVILDLMMPKINGFALLDRAMAPSSRTKKIPFIVLSAKHSVDDQKKAFEKGARLYLQKPFEPDRLLRNLMLYVESSEMVEKPKRHSLREVEKAMELRSTFSAGVNRFSDGGTPSDGKLVKKRHPSAGTSRY